jgi:hypothetical protein
MGQPWQVSWHGTSWIGPLGQHSQDRSPWISLKGHLGWLSLIRTERTGHDSGVQRTSDKCVCAKQLGQDSCDRTAGTGQSGQDNWDRTAGTGQLGEESLFRTAVTGQPGQDAGTGQPGH